MVVCDLPRAHGPVCWCVVAEVEKRAGCRGSPYNSPASATTEDGCGRGPALSLCPSHHSADVSPSVAPTLFTTRILALYPIHYYSDSTPSI